ncbi:MAG: hypothetical protein II007_12335 [Gammaproteobacteria bacterium]|nr:hypothetical protein [Gammaproteobacteria bacterium]
MRNRKTISGFGLKRQCGIALLSALVILIIVAVIGIALGRSGVVGQRSVTATSDQLIAVTAAEGTLTALERATRRNLFGTNAKSYLPGSYVDDMNELDGSTANPTWWQAESGATWMTFGTGTAFGSGGDLEAESAMTTSLDSMGLASMPEFRVEVDPTNTGLRKLNAGEGTEGLRLYQITVKAAGRGNAEVVLQSVYGIMEVDK